LAMQPAGHNITSFEATDAEWVVVNSAGCGALMKEYGHLLREDPAFAARAEAFSQRVCDVSELLTRSPCRQPLHPMPLRVAYDDPCHLLHGQKIHAQPRALLRPIAELQLLEVPDSDWCCGSAGVYNPLHPETAQILLDRKMAHLASVQPQLIVTGNPGCILQLRQGMTQHGLAVEVLHPVEVLARAYAGGGGCGHRHISRKGRGMKAVYVERVGPPEVLIYGELPEPQPGPNDVLIRVRATSVNRLDVFMRQGSHATSITPPQILGRDIAGEVVQVGSAVQGFQPGDRVVASGSGSYAEYALAPATRTFHLPESCAFDAGGALPTAGLTAYQMLINRAPVRPGEDVLGMAAGRGVGSSAGP